MKKKAPRHYAHVAHAMHHHTHKHLPKVFYHKSSFSSITLWRGLVFFLLCGFMGYFLVYNLSPGVIDSGSLENEKMLFSLEGSPEDWGVDSNISNTHGAAANEFDFLFTETENSTTNNQLSHTDDLIQSESNQEIDQISQNITGLIIEDEESTLTGIVSDTIAEVNIETTGAVIDQNLALNIDLIKYLIKGSLLPSDQTISGGASVIGAIDSSLEVDSSSTSLPSDTLPIEENISCKTPWGETVQHKDFILSYKQRADVNSLCNVQKRYCFNGKLTGSYKQKSCKEDLKYVYQEVIPISENDPKSIDPFIQPSPATLSGANFDIHGKINTSSQTRDTWSDSGAPLLHSTGLYIQQISATGSFCTTSWGETLTNGKFVKAYRSPIGLIDMPCEVELRLCTNSVLKGSFTHQSCLYKNMTYSDYLLDKGEDTNEANTIDMINSVSSQSSKDADTHTSFWNKLSNYF